ncbi:MAG: hypothetical protein JW776_04765 [Candidatus Lokiarchaeota archaeon]|nr:hypothetical protein [Candidatus Lokiarchaeota archaeon]
MYTERDWDIVLIILAFCCGVLPGVICLLVNLSKPEDKCTICGSRVSVTGPPQQVHVHETERIIIETEAKPSTQESKLTSEKNTNSELKFCPNCGGILGDANNFCELCGEDLRKYA